MARCAASRWFFSFCGAARGTAALLRVLPCVRHCRRGDCAPDSPKARSSSHLRRVDWALLLAHRLDARRPLPSPSDASAAASPPRRPPRVPSSSSSLSSCSQPVAPTTSESDFALRVRSAARPLTFSVCRLPGAAEQLAILAAACDSYSPVAKGGLPYVTRHL